MNPPKKLNLTTGPIEWDEESLAQARANSPQARMLGLAPYLIPGGLGAAMLTQRGLLNLLRDPRLEMMFRSGLLR